MKISLALGPRQPLNRQTAWGCLTSNLALPGSGSLLAGYRTGYAQLALAMIGLAGTSWFGIQFIVWQLLNWSKFHGPEIDPMEALEAIWRHLRWALLSLAIAALAWIWALATSLRILQAAKKAESPQVPPKLP